MSYAPGYYSAVMDTEHYTSDLNLIALVKAKKVRHERTTGYGRNDKVWVLVRVLVPLTGADADAFEDAADDSVIFAGNWKPEAGPTTAEQSIPDELAEAAKSTVLEDMSEGALAMQRRLDSLASSAATVATVAGFVGLVAGGLWLWNKIKR